MTVTDTVVKTARDRFVRLREWSADNRLREWVSAALALPSIGVGLPLLFDSAGQSKTYAYDWLHEQMRLHWVGLGMLMGVLLVMSGFLTPRDKPNGFAFAGGLALFVFYLLITVSAAYGSSEGGATSHPSIYSAGCLYGVLIAYLYRTRRAK